MDVLLVAQIATVGLVLTGGIVVLVAARRFHRHRAKLERIGEKHGLAPAPRPIPKTFSKKASRFEGRDAPAKLKHVLVGRGQTSGVMLAERRIDGTRHVLLLFHLNGPAHLDGFFVRPEEGRAIQLHWRAPLERWNDQKALSMGARVMFSLATVGERPGAEPLGLEIQDDRVWIHTLQPVRGEALERFVDDAMRLRALLVRSLERANGSPSHASGGTQRVPSSGAAVTVLGAG